MRKQLFLGVLLLVGAAPVSVPATAQTKENDSITGVETVTVTARRRSEDEQKVPAAITPISGEELRITGTHSAIDLQTLAPSLTVTGDLGSRDTDVFTIRGQSQPFGGADPGVQTYFAEVPFNASGRGTDYDLQDVQVLNGPQGTLFGRNTTGGAVLFEPKRPDDQFGGYLDVSLSNYVGREAQAAVNIPFDDTLAIRVAGDIADRKGFTDDISTGQDLDNVDYQAFRVGVDWKPFSGFDNYAAFDFLHDLNNGTGAELTGVNVATLDNLATQQLQALLQPVGLSFCPSPANYGSYPTVAPTCGALAAFEGAMLNALSEQQTLGPRKTTSSITLGYRRQSWGATDIATYNLAPEITLRNIFGFRSDKEQPSFDYDGSALPILDIANSRTWESNNLQVTEEFQVLGQNDDNSFNWIVGFYHELDHPGGYSEVQRDTFGGAQPPVSPLSGFGTTEIDALNNGGTSTAIYGSATYNASSWINGLSFTAGGRYTWDHKIADSITCYAGYPLFTGCPLPLPKSGLPSPPDSNYMSQHANFHAPTWTLAADYQVTDDSMVYATYRRGYKSGGFNSGAGSATDYAEFKPEYLTDVELGTKNSWTILGVPGRTNFDAYYGWYDDVQKNDEIGVCTFDGTGCSMVEPAAITFNAARAKIKGVEFQSTIIPDENFQIDVFYSYTDTQYDKFILPEEILLLPGGGETTNGLTDHAGNPFAYTPKNKFGITPRFHIPIDRALGTPVLSASVYWQSSEWFTDLSDIESTCSAFVHPAMLGEPYTCLAGARQAPKQGAYTLVNLRFDWDNFMDSPFDLSLFATNVTNKTYKIGDNALLHLTGTSASIYGEPRMFGVEARVRFGQDAQP